MASGCVSLRADPVAKRAEFENNPAMDARRARWAWAGGALIAFGASRLVGGARAAARWEQVPAAPPPEASDGVPLRFVRATGAIEPPLAVREVVRGGGLVLVIDDARRLLSLGSDASGSPSIEVIAEPVRVAPFVLEGARYVYARPKGAATVDGLDPAEGPADLVLREGARERVIARGEKVTAFIGVRGDEVVFVAEDARGVPGVRAVSIAEGASKAELPPVRCLTNCSLGPDGARDPRFEALPVSLEELPR